jgi:hypothetical protein
MKYAERAQRRSSLLAGYGNRCRSCKSGYFLFVVHDTAYLVAFGGRERVPGDSSASEHGRTRISLATTCRLELTSESDVTTLSLFVLTNI